MSWTSCEKCNVALDWGAFYCYSCGAKNPQGKQDYIDINKELERAKKERPENYQQEGNL